MFADRIIVATESIELIRRLFTSVLCDIMIETYQLDLVQLLLAVDVRSFTVANKVCQFFQVFQYIS
jgi:hypothetical protein